MNPEEAGQIGHKPNRPQSNRPQVKIIEELKLSSKYSYVLQGGRGGIWFFWRKIVIFHTKYPKIFAPPSARRTFFKCLPSPPLTWNPGSAPVLYQEMFYHWYENKLNINVWLYLAGSIPNCRFPVCRIPNCRVQFTDSQIADMWKIIK